MANGWQSVGIQQGPGLGSDYPFRAPSDDVRYLLGDLWLTYDDFDNVFVPPLRVAWLSGFGTGPVSNPAPYTPTHARDLVIIDSLNQVVFNSTAATSFLENAWGDHLTTLQWLTATAALRCTRHTGPPPWDPTRVWAQYIVPQSGELDSHTYQRMPKRVRSLVVGLARFDLGNVTLLEGFNINLKVTVAPSNDGGRRVNQLAIRGQPGDGLGRVPGCVESDVNIMRINTVAPTDSGDFTLDASGCYRIQRPVIKA